MDNAFVIVDYADGARALLDLCMFAEASEHQEERCRWWAPLGKVEAFLELHGARGPAGHRPPRDRHREGARSPRGLRGLPPRGRACLEHLDFIDAIRREAPQAWAGGGPPVGGHGRGPRSARSPRPSGHDGRGARRDRL
ncbi:MAG: hypothetical protein R2746_04725 [Acidimicrobiales bacterium]